MTGASTCVTPVAANVLHANKVILYTLSKFWVSHKQNCTKVFMLKMGSHIYVEMIFNDFEIICWEILELFTDKVD